MREIKFRGKRVDNGEWIYGFFVFDEFKGFEGKAGIAFTDGPLGFEVVEVDIKTVGQYTGLKDKNGKEIYEGDTIQLSGGGPGYFILYGHPRVCIGEYVDDDLTYDEDSEPVLSYGVYMETKRGPAGLSQTTAGKFEVLQWTS